MRKRLYRDILELLKVYDAIGQFQIDKCLEEDSDEEKEEKDRDTMKISKAGVEEEKEKTKAGEERKSRSKRQSVAAIEAQMAKNTALYDEKMDILSGTFEREIKQSKASKEIKASVESFVPKLDEAYQKMISLSEEGLQMVKRQEEEIEDMHGLLVETAEMQAKLTLQYSVPLLPTATEIDLDAPIERKSPLDMFKAIGKKIASKAGAGGAAGGAMAQAEQMASAMEAKEKANEGMAQVADAGKSALSAVTGGLGAVTGALSGMGSSSAASSSSNLVVKDEGKEEKEGAEGLLLEEGRSHTPNEEEGDEEDNEEALEGDALIQHEIWKAENVAQKDHTHPRQPEEDEDHRLPLTLLAGICCMNIAAFFIVALIPSVPGAR